MQCGAFATDPFPCRTWWARGNIRDDSPPFERLIRKILMSCGGQLEGRLHLLHFLATGGNSSTLSRMSLANDFPP